MASTAKALNGAARKLAVRTMGWASACVLSLVLTACGGGGGGAEPAVLTPPVTPPVVLPPVVPPPVVPPPEVPPVVLPPVTAGPEVTSVLQPSVQDLRASPGLVTVATESSVRLSSLPAGFAVGTVFIHADRAYKVESLTPAPAGGYVVTTAIPLLEEVFVDLDIAGDLDFSGATFTPTDPAAATLSSGRTGRERPLLALGGLPNCSLDVSQFGTAAGGEGNCDFDYKLTGNDSSVTGVINGSIGFKKFKSIPVQYSLRGEVSTIGMSADLIMKLTASFTLPVKELEAQELEVGVVEVPIASTLGLVSVAIPIWVVVEPKLSAGIVAAAEFSAPIQSKAIRTKTENIAVSGSTGAIAKAFSVLPVTVNPGSGGSPVGLSVNFKMFAGGKTGIYLRTYKGIISAGAYVKGGYDIEASGDYDLARATADNPFGACIDAVGAMSIYAGGEAQFAGAKLFTTLLKRFGGLNLGTRDDKVKAQAEIKLLTGEDEIYKTAGGCDAELVVQSCPSEPLALKAIIETAIYSNGQRDLEETTATFDFARYIAVNRGTTAEALNTFEYEYQQVITRGAEFQSRPAIYNLPSADPVPIMQLGKEPAFPGNSWLTAESAAYLRAVARACMPVDTAWELIPGSSAVDECDTYSYVPTVGFNDTGSPPPSETAQYRREETLAAVKDEVIKYGVPQVRDALNIALGDFSVLPGVSDPSAPVLTTMFSNLIGPDAGSRYAQRAYLVPPYSPSDASNVLTTQQRLAIGAYRSNLMCLRNALDSMRAAKNEACGGACDDNPSPVGP